MGKKNLKSEAIQETYQKAHGKNSSQGGQGRNDQVGISGPKK